MATDLTSYYPGNPLRKPKSKGSESTPVSTVAPTLDVMGLFKQIGQALGSVPMVPAPQPTGPTIGALPTIGPVDWNSINPYGGVGFDAKTVLNAGNIQGGGYAKEATRQEAGRQQKAAKPSGPSAVNWDFAGSGVGHIIGAESGGNPNARNPRSSASGLGQFLDSTWMDKDLRKRAGYDNIDDKTWMANKANPTAQLAMTAAYQARNTESWQKQMGTTPTPGQQYGMHFLDAQPFQLLTQVAATNPGHDGASMFPDAARANPEVFYKDPKTRKQPRTAAELYDEITRRGGGDGSDPFTMPALVGVDPATAMGMIPNPTRHVAPTISAPPAMGTAPARPQQEEIDTQSILADLKKFAPEQFDSKKANSRRLGEVLAGMATGAASVDARRGAGAVLAAIGAGGAQAAAHWQATTDADEAQHKEAQRLFGLSLATKGIDLNEGNRRIRGANKEAEWQDARDKIVTDYTNAESKWKVDTQNLLASDASLKQYEQDVDGANMVRARVGLQAIEQQAALTNQQLTGQLDLDLKKFLFEEERGTKGITVAQERAVNAMAADTGLDPKTVLATTSPAKPTPESNALQGFAYIAAGNKPAAISSLGRELVLAGRTDLIVDPTLKKQITTLIQKGQVDLAAQAVGRFLNQAEAQTPGASVSLAQLMAGSGLPFATAFAKRAQVKTPVAATPPAGTK